MSSSGHRSVVAATLGALLSLEATVLAAPAPTAPPAPAPVASEGEDKTVEADWPRSREHYEKGDLLYEEKKWELALAEYLRSREIFPTRNATTSAARCLAKLGRSYEAFDMYEKALNISAVSDDDLKGIQQRIDAQKSLEKGLSLFKEESWDEARAAFLRARELYPTRAATTNVAVCLNQLRRFDEALDMFEQALKFPNLSADERRMIEQEITDLQARVGTLVVEAGEPGASLMIDGRSRGTLPLAGPLRVVVGPHEVRAYREGSDPFGATVAISAKQQAVARLRSLSTIGQLKVREQCGRALDVMVDGTLVGKTPWEGVVTAGERLVLLRGKVDSDAAAECAPNRGEALPRRPSASQGAIELGTQPASVRIQPQQVTKLTLTAEELEASMWIAPTPAGASVAIDSVVVGRGTWAGRLRVGAHKVEVTAEGFLPETRQVNLGRAKREVVRIELQRAAKTPSWFTPRSAAAGAYGVGAMGLGVFAVTGGIALGSLDKVKARCGGTQCPGSEKGNVAAAGTFATALTVGLVVGSIGVAAGTIVLLMTRPEGSRRRLGAVSARSQPADGLSLRAGVGLGRFTFEGRF